MAFVPQTQDDEEKRRTEAGGGALGSFGSTAGGAAPTQPKFVNVADYLSKNQEGSAQIGQAAADKLSQQRDTAGGLVSGTGNQFNTDVSKGTVNLDQDVLNSGLNDSTNFVKDPNNVAKFTAMRDASYNGPSSIQNESGFAPTDTAVSGLKTTAAGLGTEEGRNALVGSLSDHPTTGKTALNQLLLQGSPDAAKKIQDTAGTFNSVEDQWNQILANAPSAVNAAKTTSDATKAATGTALTGAENKFTSGLNDKLTQATNQRDAFNLDYQNLNNAVNSSTPNLNQKQLDELGISDAQPYLSKLNEFNQQLDLYGNPVPLSGYVQNQGQANTNIPTLGGVANPDDYAREAALQQLSGQDLGLAETPEAAYVSNGRLPSGVDYQGAFGQAGSTLHGDELSFLQNLSSNYPQSGGDSSGFYSKYYPAVGHVPGSEYGATNGAANGDYYSTPTAGATAPGGYQIAPPPAGIQPGTPPPHPQPTSNPPSNLVPGTEQWNPWTGQWEGTQFQPNTPPPPTGGGGIVAR